MIGIDQMSGEEPKQAPKKDEEPNSGLWGNVEIEALPNPGSLPPPPMEAAGSPYDLPLRKGTLMGIAVARDESGAPPTMFRRTPSSGQTKVPGHDSEPILDLTQTQSPTTTPLGGMPTETFLAASGATKARSYYRADEMSRTLIGGSAPAPDVAPVPRPRVEPAPITFQVGRHATAPGFPALEPLRQPGRPPSVEPAPPLNKSTLVGVAMPKEVRDALAAGVADVGLAPAYTYAPASEPPPSSSRANPLGRFRIQKKLGAGGAGAVYLARKVDVGGEQQELAIKVLREHVYRDPAALKALFREARLAAKMDHRHVVRVMDIGYHKKQPYLVMEYVDGLSLATLMTHPVRLPIPIAIRCVVDTLYGLDYAHKLRGDHGEPLGLVHCDVSPHNMLVGVDGVTKLADFGVARTREEDGEEFVLRGKPEYAAPELIRGEQVRPETDAYSAGAVLFRLVTGTAAFSGETEAEIVDKIIRTCAPAPSSIKPDLPRWLDEFCAQALAHDIASRFPSCLEMARALERSAEAQRMIADRATVGEWVRRVRRSLEGGADFKLSEIETIIGQSAHPGPPEGPTEPPPVQGDDELQSVAMRLGLGVAGGILIVGALLWLLLAPSSFKTTFGVAEPAPSAPPEPSLMEPGAVLLQLSANLPASEARSPGVSTEARVEPASSAESMAAVSSAAPAVASASVPRTLAPAAKVVTPRPASAAPKRTAPAASSSSSTPVASENVVEPAVDVAPGPAASSSPAP